MSLVYRTMGQMSGPKKIVELPSSPGDWKKLDREANHLHNGRLWRWIPAGCVLCIESGDAKDQTLQSVDNPDFYLCQNHGKLEKVPFRCKREYTVSLGDKSVDSSHVTEDFFLFPVNQSSSERERLIKEIISEAMGHEMQNDDLFSEE